MKKKLFFTAFIFLCTILNANAQTVIFQEDFESPTPPDFLPAGWVSESRGLIEILPWQVQDFSSTTDSYGFSGKLALLINSQLTDMLLITPQINLPAGNTYSLTFQIGTLTESGVGLSEESHYAVYALPATATFTGTETPLLEETITVSNIANLKTVNLSNYAGQNIKVYFRQYDSPDFLLSYLLLDTVKITQQATLGTSETNITASDFGIYPNPASDYVYIKSKSKIMKAEIFDGAGRKVKVVLSDNRIDIKDLLPGTYLINATTENKTYSQKLIKK